jgi:hypothetical protein
MIASTGIRHEHPNRLGQSGLLTKTIRNFEGIGLISRPP